MSADIHDKAESIRKAAQHASSSDAQIAWDSLADDARQVADNLTTSDLRIQLGKTGLVQDCGHLLATGSSNDSVLDPDTLQSKTQLLRVIGNMCYENDDNRQQADEAKVPVTLVKALQALLSRTGEWTLPELKFTRAAVGALLNMSLAYDPIRNQLSTPEAIALLLALVDSRPAQSRKPSVYVIGSWVSGPSADQDEAEWRQRIETGALIATWAMTMLEELTTDDKASLATSEGVKALASVIVSCQDDSNSLPYSGWNNEDVSDRTSVDLELITNASSLLEAVAIDHEQARQALGLRALSDDGGLILAQLMDFVESSSVPQYWSKREGDSSGLEKSFSLVKSAVVRAIVEAPNSDVVMNKLFALGHKSWLVIRLVNWVQEAQQGREDLLICASHMLAALARRDEHCVSLVHQYGVVEPLSQIVLSKTAQQFVKRDRNATNLGEVTQILYGVVSLLRHLAIPGELLMTNKIILGDSGIIGPVSCLLRKELDMVGPLQNSVVGLLKHLSAANGKFFLGGSVCPPDADAWFTPSVANSLRILEAECALGEPVSTPVDLIVSLISRTDDVRLRSEATRVLVNIVRTLFATKPLATTELAAASPITPTLTASAQSSLNAEETLKRRGRPKIVRQDVVEALSEMVRLSEKYPMLINEAIVGLTLLAGSGSAGAIFVLDALLKEHAKLEPLDQQSSNGQSEPLTDSSRNRARSSTQSSTSRTASLAISPAGDPPCSIEMISNWFGSFASGQIVPSTRPESNLTNGLTAVNQSLTTSTPLASVNVKPEMIGNACALIITVTRGSEVARADTRQIEILKSKLLGPLLGCLDVVKDGQYQQATVTNSSWGQLVKTIERCAQVVGAKPA
ncbi:hypothetical protein OIV83_002887 [Microbotryomycetes sp. JL201]|nr:hypothetical protein OIV83_002887 [Microbotryomycetes sp. JL201]